MPKKFRSKCPMTNLLDLIGDKWSLIVVRDLFLQRNTFSQLLNQGEENISTNILSDRLKKLKESGFIDFVNDRNDHKVKYYYLTDKGMDLNTLLYEMSMWSNIYLDRDYNKVSTYFFKVTQDLSRDLVISKSKSVYKKERDKLLDYHRNQQLYNVSF